MSLTIYHIALSSLCNMIYCTYNIHAIILCCQLHVFFFADNNITNGEDVFPAVGITVNRTAYSANYNGNCKHTSYDIQIKNCTGYLVYYLQPITGACSTAYCFGKYMLCIYYKCLVQLFVSCEFSCRVVMQFTQLTMHDIDNRSSAHYRMLF